jgi:hypothetical protein
MLSLDLEARVSGGAVAPAGHGGGDARAGGPDFELGD